VIDPARARAAFLDSAWVRTRLPPSLMDRMPPFFEQQRIVNRVFWEGGRPLRQIEDLHELLTTTRLVTLPLWVLGTDEVKQTIAGDATEDGGAVTYARGLSALAARDYSEAADLFAEAEAGGLQGAALRPLRVYALCAAQQLDEARALARGLAPRDPDEVHFWAWIGKQFGVGPFGK
jgi:hypothetical protein